MLPTRCAPGFTACSTRPMSRISRLYVALVTLAGAVAIAESVVGVRGVARSPEVVTLAALTLLSGRFPIRLPGLPASCTISEIFAFIAVLLFGPAPATLTLAADGLLLSLAQRRRSLDRVVFNTAESALSIWLAGHAFHLAAAYPPLVHAPIPASGLLGPVLVMAAVYFLANSALSLHAIALETHASALGLWRQHLVHLGVQCLSSASLAALVVQGTAGINWAAFAFLAPPLAALYLGAYLFAARLADAQRHLAEINQLYRSTVECLAVAIDAKDQVTHGHIRRVQRFSLALARRLGVTDDEELKALEVAAVLHDVGKLAVPDYILNKPGPLTPAEFERMKRHARAGAEILGAAGFPYPVVPIVRHHHENWDGSGYPDGLAGSRIPRGARILAVVDCFDALTSDRPYRARLTVPDAIEVLRARRATMYDPDVVDAFIEILPELLKAPQELDASHRAARAVSEKSEPTLPRASAVA
jgi:putative nucleotidyltransferase with HDIG domain